MRALTANDIAAELGRSPSWVYEHWKRMCHDEGMPKPLHESGGLVWSAAHIYAWLDRALPPDLRAAAAAHRAAVKAYGRARADDLDVDAWRDRLAAARGVR